MSIINLNGTFILFFANVISKLFGAFYRLPLSNILGAEGMGLYQMAFPVYSFLLTLITSGISITLTRKIANLRARQDDLGIYKCFVLGRNTSLFFGIFFFLAIIFLAYPLSLLQGNVNAIYGYLSISIGFIFACLLSAYRGYFQGYNNMMPTALSQVLEQGAKLVFGLIFAYIFFRFGTTYGVLGALLGISLSEIISLIYIIAISKKRIKKYNVSLSTQDYKTFIKQVFPVSLAYVLLPLSSLIDSFIVINLLVKSGFNVAYATSLYGIETGMILPLVNMPNVLISAIALAGLPDITYKVSKSIDVSAQIKGMFKIVLMFILPCAVGLFVLSKPILQTIFVTLDANLLNVAVWLLRLSAFEMFFLSFVTISNALLQSFGKIKLPAISLSVAIMVKLILTIIFVSNNALNIYGLVLASTVGYFVCAFIDLICVKRQVKFRLSILEICAILLSCIAMTAVVLILQYLHFSNLLKLFLQILLAIFTYFAMLMLFKQFNYKDIKKVLQTKGS